MIGHTTISAVLARFGPMSMEALASYLATGRYGGADPEALAIEVNAMIESSIVVAITEHCGVPVGPLWVALAPWWPCRTPMERFDHLTIWQPNQVQALRRLHPDSIVGSWKVAQRAGCTLEQLRAFLRRNPRPRMDAA